VWATEFIGMQLTWAPEPPRRRTTASASAGVSLIPSIITYS